MVKKVLKRLKPRRYSRVMKKALGARTLMRKKKAMARKMVKLTTRRKPRVILRKKNYRKNNYSKNNIRSKSKVPSQMKYTRIGKIRANRLYVHNAKLRVTVGVPSVGVVDGFLNKKLLTSSGALTNQQPVPTVYQTALNERCVSSFANNLDLSNSLDTALTQASIKLQSTTLNFFGNLKDASILSFYHPVMCTQATFNSFMSFFTQDRAAFILYIRRVLDAVPLVLIDAQQADNVVNPAIQYQVTTVGLFYQALLDGRQQGLLFNANLPGFLANFRSCEAFFNEDVQAFLDPLFAALTVTQTDGLETFYTGHYQMWDVVNFQRTIGNVYNQRMFKNFSDQIATEVLNNNVPAQNGICQALVDNLYFGPFLNGQHALLIPQLQALYPGPQNVPPVPLQNITHILPIQPHVFTVSRSFRWRSILASLSFVPRELREALVAFMLDITYDVLANLGNWTNPNQRDLLYFWSILAGNQQIIVKKFNYNSLITMGVLRHKTASMNKSVTYYPKDTPNMHFLILDSNVSCEITQRLSRDYTPLLNILKSIDNTRDVKELLTLQARQIIMKLDPSINFVSL